MRAIIAALLCCCLAAPLCAQEEQDREVFFSLASERTYLPGEKPTVAVYSHNVSTLEFRVYRVKDEVKFFSQMQELHTFGGRGPAMPKQARTWLEKFHAWKHRIWAWFRDFIRAQFSPESRHKIRLWRMGRKEKKQGPKIESYAQVPVLNPQQVVSVWKWTVPAHQRWESQTVPIPVSEKGVYLVEATNGQLRAYTVIVVTEIAIITKGAPGRLMSFVVDRRSGDPIAGAMVRVWIDQQEVAAKSADQQGLLDTALDEAKPENVAVLATSGDQFAINTPGAWNLGAGPDRNLKGYTYTDRPVYRPGDIVHFKTIVRSESTTGYEIPKQRELRLELRDPQSYQTIWQQTVTLSGMGTAHWDYAIPSDATLGFYYLQMQSGQDRYIEGVSFSVEDYKKPEYQVKVTALTPRVLEGQPIKAMIDARYYFGEPVANAKVKWVVHTGTYWPLGRPESDDEAGEYQGENPDADQRDTYGGEQERENSGTLDADGKLQIEFPTRVDSKKQDLVYRVEARVTDAGNREISGHGFALATYGSFFLSAQPDSFVYTKGSAATITVTAQDYDKKPVQTPFRVEMNRWDWHKGAGPAITTTQGQTGSDGKGQVKLTIPDAGEFRVRVMANTPEKRQVETTAYLWAPGESPWWSGPAQERVQIVPDKKTYQPGDTAHVLIVTGKEPASVLVTAEGNGLYSGQVIKSPGGSITVDVPVKPEYAPNFYVGAVFIRDNKLYQGSKSLTVPPTQHELKVQLVPSKPQYQPGEAASYTVKATDVSGKPVAGAEFSLGVVDEAIYAIKPDTTPNVMNAFYGRVYSKVSTDTSLTYYFNGQAGKRAMQLANARPSRRLAQLKPERLVQPKVRKAFPDTAYWVADVNTGSNGQALVRFNYPDAITSWRATTRGVTQNTMVGGAVENTIVRKNLMVRLVVPRFFRRGDEITLSTIVQNYLPTEKTARVSMEFDGLQVIEGGTRDVSVPSRGLMKVDYRVRVLDVDSARVLGKALTDVESDAMELTLPVVPFGVKLAIAKSGSIADGSSETVQPVAFPRGAEQGTRKLTISVTPSVAGTVFAALNFLTSYPYGCTEQTMSSLLPDVLVANAIQKLGVKSNIDPVTLKKQVQAGLDRLYNYQHPDGGWGWWQSDDSHPFMTAYVLAGLSQAKASGFDVKQDAIDKGSGWLKPYFGRSQKVKTDLRAYMAYALVLNGAHQTAILDSVWSQRSTLTSYGKALLGLAMVEMNDPRSAELTKQLENEAKQDDSQAWWQTDMNYLMDFSGDTTPQATAYVLKLLTRTAPNNPLLAKAAVYLVNHRDQGYYWDSTEQTAMVIYGLTDYLARTQELKPNYGVEVQVNGKAVETKKFTAADALAPATTIALNESQLAPGDNQVRIAKAGDGRLYWSLRGEYYSNASKAVNTGSFKLSVAREYYKLTSQQQGDRVVYHLDRLAGPVDVGDTLAVRITVGGSDWKYLMIEDPIPSGTESIARDDLYQLDEKPDWWGRWSSYRELRDDRTTFFNLYFPQGQHEYVYLLKVVNPGVFRVSPTRVEPMYQPEYLATSDALTVTVK